MPPSKMNMKRKRKNKKPRPSAARPAVDLSLLWKAAFCQNAQLRRGEWLRVDLAAGLRAIQKALQSNGGGGGVSLSYLSTAYLGLCRIMASQVHHFCDNVTVPQIDFEELNEQLRSRRGRGRRCRDNAVSPIDDSHRADPLLREFYDTCAKIEAFKVQQQQQQQEQMTETDGALPLASLLSAAQLSSLNQTVETNSAGTVNESEATAYFEGLYEQMNSANFEDEFADVMDEHFRNGKTNKKKKKKEITDSESGPSKQLSDLHQHEIPPVIAATEVHTDIYEDIYVPPVELSMPVEEKKEEEEEDADKVNEPSTVKEQQLPLALPNEASILKALAAPLPDKRPRRRLRRVRRKRARAKLTRAKRLSGLKLHMEEYCKSKSGYQFAVEEDADSKLTEPSRSMSEHLTPHFSPAVASRSHSECSEPPPQQESEKQIVAQESTVSELQPPLVANDDCTEVQINTTSTVSPSDVDLRDSLSPLIVPSVNADFAEDNGFSDNFVDISEVPKQPQVPAVKPLKRQPFPVVKNYRQVQVNTGENVASLPASTEKISDNQILSLLNSTMDEQSANELPFADFVNCIKQPPSRQNVALTFCSLLSLSSQPNSGVKLNDEKATVNSGTSKKKLADFPKLTISLTSKSAISGQSKLN